MILLLLAGGYAWLRLTPDDPATVRLTVHNPFPTDILIHAVKIGGLQQPLPGVQDSEKPRLPPRSSWQGRFVTGTTGFVLMVVQMTRLDTGEHIEARGTVELLSDLTCRTSIRYASGESIRLNPCLHDIDSDYPN